MSLVQTRGYCQQTIPFPMLWVVTTKLNGGYPRAADRIIVFQILPLFRFASPSRERIKGEGVSPLKEIHESFPAHCSGS